MQYNTIWLLIAMIFSNTKKMMAKLKSFLISKTPANRMATASEIAEGFLYLASDASKFMIGGELLLDGSARTL